MDLPLEVQMCFLLEFWLCIHALACVVCRRPSSNSAQTAISLSQIGFISKINQVPAFTHHQNASLTGMLQKSSGHSIQLFGPLACSPIFSRAQLLTTIARCSKILIAPPKPCRHANAPNLLAAGAATSAPCHNIPRLCCVRLHMECIRSVQILIEFFCFTVCSRLASHLADIVVLHDALSMLEDAASARPLLGLHLSAQWQVFVTTIVSIAPGRSDPSGNAFRHANRSLVPVCKCSHRGSSVTAMSR